MFHGHSSMRRAGIALLVLASFVAGITSLPHTEGSEDLVCSPVVVAHDETAHYVGAVRGSGGADAQHCFLCHTARSFCSVLDRFEQRDGRLRGERPHIGPIDRRSLAGWTVGPGRAPPAFTIPI
jgi:hypothetical protein